MLIGGWLNVVRIKVYFKLTEFTGVQHARITLENRRVQMGHSNLKTIKAKTIKLKTGKPKAIKPEPKAKPGKPKPNTSSPNKTQVAIYCRVSTTDQSCERQERDLKAFAKRAGYKVLEVFKETASGARNDRLERAKVIQLARDRRINAVLVTELTRWGRSTTDLLSSLQELEGYGVSVIAQTGLQFDLGSPQGKLFASLMAALAEFERDLLRERVRSGVAAAQARGVRFGRQAGQRVKADKIAPVVLERVRAGESYREIARVLKVNKNTVGSIVRRARADGVLVSSVIG
jgi:putative DNA-invertase from lambdoid prophage Rac